MAPTDPQPPDDDDAKDRFAETVRRKEERRLRARREGDRSVWFGLGMMGMVGWSVGIPTVLGVAAGLWADRTFGGRYSWTLMGLLLGVLVGCLSAWYWIQRNRK